MMRRFTDQNGGAACKPIDKESPSHILVCYINSMLSRPRRAPALRSISFSLLLGAILLFLRSSPLVSQTRPRPAPLPRTVIIDTDVGADDLMAIAFLLSRPDIRVEAITIVNGMAHVPEGAKNVLRLLELAGSREMGRESV